jgi:hypothetical protein
MTTASGSDSAVIYDGGRVLIETVATYINEFMYDLHWTECVSLVTTILL